MIPVQKISLYEFAKSALGGKEPKSVIFVDSDKKNEISRVEYYGNNDPLPSLEFSPNDFFEKMHNSNNYQNSFDPNFPGIV